MAEDNIVRPNFENKRRLPSKDIKKIGLRGVSELVPERIRVASEIIVEAEVAFGAYDATEGHDEEALIQIEKLGRAKQLALKSLPKRDRARAERIAAKRLEEIKTKADENPEPPETAA